ncbi:MAG: peptidylprolyl isomerase [Cyanobacteria bacterium J06635_15]
MTALFRRWWIVGALIVALVIGGCTGEPEASTPASSDGASAPTETAPSETVAEEPAAGAIASLPTLNGMATVELVVNGSPIVIEVDGTNAPITAGNFVDLVERGVYDGTVFHRVIREPDPFVVQGGDPMSKDPSVPTELLGQGSFIDPETEAPRYIPLEIKPAGAEQPIYSQTFGVAGVSEPPQLNHVRGAVAMARSQIPDSASAQFYIALADLPFLDGDYAVFGTVLEGMDAVDGIEQGDTLESATVTAGLENLNSDSAESEAPADSEAEPEAE